MTQNNDKNSGEVIELIISEDKAHTSELYEGNGQKITRIEIVAAPMKGSNSNGK